MKIALLVGPRKSVPPRGTGGPETVVAALAERLVRRGHDVLLYASGDSSSSATVKSLHPRCVEAVFQETPPGPGLEEMLLHGLWGEQDFWAIRDAVREEVDVIHAHDHHFLTAARGVARPMVVTLHHAVHGERRNALWERLHRHFNGFQNIQVVTICHWLAQVFPPNADIHVIPNGIELSDFPLSVRPREYLLSLGRIDGLKGTHVAVEVARRAGVPLRIAGPVGDPEYFERYVSPFVDGNLVTYVGEVGHPERLELYGGARALLLPSQGMDGGPLTAAESMATGTPVIAFRRGGPGELIADGHTGFLIEDDDVTAMAECVARLGELSPAKIHARAQEQFSLDTMAQRYEHAYEAAMAAYRPVDELPPPTATALPSS